MSYFESFRRDLANAMTTSRPEGHGDEGVGIADAMDEETGEFGSAAVGGTLPGYGYKVSGMQEGGGYGYEGATYQDARLEQDALKTVPLEPDSEFVSGKDQITAWQAGWNITNAIQGMFVVSLPYAVLHGGWWAVLALTGIAWICYYTGLILVDCLYDDSGVRIRGSYVEVAEACWGPTLGGRMVHAAQLIELLMTCILYVVLCGDLLEGMFPSSAMENTSWMMLATMPLFACAFLTTLGSVSTLSFWNTVSHVIINAVIVMYCLTRAGSWVWSKVTWSLDIHTFPTVIGIVVFSYTSHIFLPTLEGNMVDRTYFRPMLRWSHIAAALFKSLFGFIGFLTFGDYTQDEVTNNLPTQEFKTVINFVLLLKALLSYPLPYYAAVQLMEHSFFRSNPLPSCLGDGGIIKDWGIALRVGLVIFTLLAAISIPHFALLMGLIGSCTGCMLSFIWPCIFHLKLKGGTMTRSRRIADWTIISLGVFFGTIGIIYSSSALSSAMNAIPEYY